MPHLAKLFLNGRSQAVRLPAEFRFDSNAVYIRRDEQTGDVILSKKPGTWDDFFQMVQDNPAPDDFMADRDVSLPQIRDDR